MLKNTLFMLSKLTFYYSTSTPASQNFQVVYGTTENIMRNSVLSPEQYLENYKLINKLDATYTYFVQKYDDNLAACNQPMHLVFECCSSLTNKFNQGKLPMTGRCRKFN